MPLEPWKEGVWSRLRAGVIRFWPAVLGVVGLATSFVGPWVLTRWTATPLPLVSLRVEPAIIDEGDTVQVSWTVRNVQTLLIEPFGALTPSDGSRSLQLRQTTEFRAFASAVNGQFTDQRTVTVRAAKAAVPMPATPPRPRSNRPPATPATSPSVIPQNRTGASNIESRTFNLTWSCEETTSSTVKQPVAKEGGPFWVARWDLPTVLNAKVYELTPPTFDPGTRTINGGYRFVGADRLLSGGCPQGQATLVLTWGPLSPPSAPTAVRIQ